MTETIIVIAIVAVAVCAIVWSVRRALAGKSKCGGCTGCSGAAPDSNSCDGLRGGRP